VAEERGGEKGFRLRLSRDSSSGDELVIQAHLGDEERLALLVVLSEEDNPARVRNPFPSGSDGSAEEKASSFEGLTGLGDGDGLKSG